MQTKLCTFLHFHTGISAHARAVAGTMNNPQAGKEKSLEFLTHALAEVSTSPRHVDTGASRVPGTPLWRGCTHT